MTSYTKPTDGMQFLPSIVASIRYTKEQTFLDSSGLTDEEMEWAQKLARDAVHCNDDYEAICAEISRRITEKFNPLWEYDILVDAHG